MSVDLKGGPDDGLFSVNFRDPPVRDIGSFARGYHRAANRLASEFSRSRDYDAYPIFFLYRHSLELYLKSVVHRGLELLQLEGGSSTVAIFSNHKLVRLLAPFRTILSARGWVWDFDEGRIKTFSDFKELVEEIERVDPDSFTMRYPIKKDQTASSPRFTLLNILTISDLMDEVLSILEAADLGLSVEFDLSAEAKAALHGFQHDT